MQPFAAPTSRSADRPRAQRRRPATRRLLRLPTMLAPGLALAIAGCGGSTSPGVAHVGATNSASASTGSGGGAPESPETSAAAQQQMVKFSQCMRTHGEPEFPEPNEGHIAIHGGPNSGLNPESQQFQTAEKACSKYSPKRQAASPQQLAKLEEQALKMSECMRHHGVPNYPDPNFSSTGGGNVRVKLKVGKQTGIEPSSPQFQAAAKACRGDSPKGKGLLAIPAPRGPAGAGAGGGSFQSSQSTGR